MQGTAIVTDSYAFLRTGLPVFTIPHRIRLLGQEVEDSELTADAMFDRLVRSGRPPSAAMPEVVSPKPDAVRATLELAARESRSIVAIHSSCMVSPVHQVVASASRDLAGVSVRVIDSRSVSLGLGFLVETAAAAAAAGSGMNRITREVAGTVPRLFASFFTESLHYLERSTGLPASLSRLGSLLGIKPLLTMEEGRLIPIEKVCSREQLTDALCAHVLEYTRIEKIGIMHHAYAEVATSLRERLPQEIPGINVVDLPYPPGLAAQLGPNVVGVLVVEGCL
jgi:DegV family protein with EDD domain